MLDTPFIRALQEYGIDAMTVPQETQITHDAHGLTIEEYVRDTDGGLMIDADHMPVIRRAYYPHPTGQAPPA